MRQWLVCEINVISKIWQHNSAKINISGGACNITISQYPISHEMHVGKGAKNKKGKNN